MAAAIGFLGLMAPGPDDHVELLGQEHVDHLRCCRRVVGKVAVGHQIYVCIDVGEHAPNDMALALLLLGADDGTGFTCDFASAVAAIVVIDVDGRAGQRGAESGHGRSDRRFLIVARQKHCNSGRRAIQAGPLDRSPNG